MPGIVGVRPEGWAIASSHNYGNYELMREISQLLYYGHLVCRCSGLGTSPPSTPAPNAGTAWVTLDTGRGTQEGIN